MSEYLIQVDEKDNEVGSVERLQAYLGDGILHRGLVVVVQNQEDQILLTQRSMVRPDLPFPAPFPGFWDVTIAGHPRWGQHEYLAPMVNELREELGIKATNGEMNYLGKFQYYAPDPIYPNSQSASTFRLSEREICGVGLLHTSDDPVINPVELASSRWVESKELAKTLSSLKMAPWASIVLTRFLGIA